MPLYVSGLGRKTIGALVTNIDLAPTIAELAGIPPPPTVDGASLVPLLRQPGRPWRKRFLVESWKVVASVDAEPGPFEVPTFNAIRTGTADADAPHSTYVAYRNGAREFYDRAIDGAQLNSLHIDSSPARVLQQSILGGWLTALETCRGSSCRDLEFGHLRTPPDR